jgi:hypothetical protein
MRKRRKRGKRWRCAKMKVTSTTTKGVEEGRERNLPH